MTDPHPVVQLERSLLGAALMSKAAVKDIVHIIGTDPDRFQEPAHQLIYASLVRLHEADEAIDAITVSEDLTAREELKEAGGATYLVELTETLRPTDMKNAERNARQLVFEPTSITSDHAQWMYDALPDYLDLLDGTRRTPHPKAPTGFRDLDKLTTGLEPGTLTVISGRPSSGKSTLLGNIARSSALAHTIPTVWIDQENSHRQVLDRILSAEARIPLHRIRAETMDHDDWARMAQTMGRVVNEPLLVHAGTRVTTEQVRQLVQESGAGLVAIDGLQHLRPCRDRETREREVSDITRALKDIALELGVAVVATAHLNRAPLQRFDPSPTLDDLRESDLIAHLADTVILIDRPEMRDQGSPRAGEADLKVVKNRYGPALDLTVAFQGHYSRFVDMVTPEEVAERRKKLERAASPPF
ncbi:DnaB-like helicase C-terminal domain-containing protein [Nocardiopsis sp. NPDC007018]|uniref:replicative DNA helicase n=1 Tax=Nocardiopsis sp. NPDC007018 TaxID=3155721 RepID=UPI00340F4023